MHVVQILAGSESEAAGPTYSVRRLAEALADRDVQSCIYTTGPSADRFQSRVRIRSFPPSLPHVPVLGRLRMAPEMQRALERDAKAGAILHAHGLWLMPNLYPAHAARRYKRPLVISPRGMLAPAAMAFSAARKTIMWAIAQKAALKAATCFHATSVQEAEEIRGHGFTAPIAIIPNGIDVVQSDEARQNRHEPSHHFTVLHLGRLHPKKGIDRLVAAWAGVEHRFPDWRLRIIGPGEGGYRDLLKRQATALGLNRITLEGPLFGAEKEAAYWGADLFVLPTLNENFGLVVAEALAHSVPVICTEGAPWSELERQGCGWWIPHGVDPLRAALTAAMSLPIEQRTEMGARGRDWVASAFCWDRVGDDMHSVYVWLTTGGPVPACISIS